MVSLYDGNLIYLDSKNNRACKDSNGAVFLYNPGCNFQHLLADLNYYINSGRTTDVLPFARYIINDNNYPAHERTFPLDN